MKYGIIGCVCLLLSACQVLPLTPFSVDTYAKEPSIFLDVSLIDITSQVHTYNRLPHIENNLPVTPDDVLQDWAHNRLRASDATSPITAEFSIIKAYMTETPSPSGKWYIFDNVTYRLDYDVMLQFKQSNRILYTQTAAGWEEHAIPQKSSLHTKERTWEKMLNNMVQKIDHKIIPEIPNKFR